MHHVITPEMQENQRKAAEEMMKLMLEQARKKAKAKKEWEENHPPCPHCGRKDELPPWLM